MYSFTEVPTKWIIAVFLISEWSQVSRCHSNHPYSDVRFQNQHQYTDARVVTNTQKSESSPKHRYQSQDLTKMCDLWPVHRCQSHHFYTVIWVVTSKQISESTPVQYTDVRDISSTERILPREATCLSTSSRILKYILYICSLLTIENVPLSGNLTW